MIKRVRLRNWKTHVDSEFEFERGVNALIGIMGSGKTSVVQAISFALYGTFPFMKSRKAGIEDMIMKRPQKKQFAEVELDFEVKGKTYSIKRRIEERKGTTIAEIRENGTILDVNPAGVTREVERVLEMDYDLFSKAVYSEQNGLDYFLRLPRGSRIKQIDDMLQVEKFERVREHTVTLLNKIHARREEAVRIHTTMDRKGVQEKREKAERDAEELTKDMHTIERKITVAEGERMRLSEQVARLAQKEAELTATKQEIKAAGVGIAELGGSLAQKQLYDEGAVTHELEQVMRELEHLEHEAGVKDGDISTMREELASVNTEIRIIKEGVKSLESLGAVCPVCESPLTGEHKHTVLEKRSSREQELRERARALGAQLETLTKEQGLLKEERSGKESIKERLSRAAEEIGFVKELEQRRKDYERALALLTTKEVLIMKEMEGSNLEELRRALQQQVAAEAELRGRLETMAQRIQQAREYVHDVRKRESEIREIEQRIAQGREIADSLNEFIVALKLTQDQLRQEFLKTVNTIMNSVWGELYPYGDYTEIRLVIENDYVLQLRGMGTWVAVDGIASGGERSLASLALRMAFSLAFIPNLKWLILDEPTHNLDVNAIRAFTEILREKMHLFTEQVFLITHEERISEGITGRVYKLERNKDIYEPTRCVAV